MVQIVAGIDHQYYANALTFLERLRFASADVRLMHVVESVLPDKSFPELKPNHPLSILLAENERQGDEELVKAGSMLEKTGYHLGTELRRGDSARCLIELATQMQAHLIAVGSAQKGHWASLFFGSVTKALTAGAEQSILIAKSPPISQSGLTAVLATDHSPYCNACIEHFLSWQATGVQRVTVVTALVHGITPPSAVPDDPIQGLVSESREEVRVMSAALCDRLRREGIECDSVLAEDFPQEAIAKTMKDTAADLLIMGARGHGFWDRFRLGSVSHFQVVATPHNVLVIRV